MSKDYYKILGIDKNASKDDIKKAFRKLAHEHHPDKKTGNEAKFKEANEAYSVLSDDAKRAQYDRFGSAGPGFGGGASGQGGGSPFGQGFNAQDFSGFDFSGFTSGQGGVEFDIGDIFGDIFGGGDRGSDDGGRGQRSRRGRDMSIDIEIPFRDAVFGAERRVLITRDAICDHCQGSGGEPGTDMKTCHTCNGKGKVQESRRSIFGNFSSTVTCTTCSGKGKVPKEVCRICRGKGIFNKQEEIIVTIPAGIDDGQMLRMTGRGEATASGGAGDLYIKIHVLRHPMFKKDGSDLYTDLRIKLSDALLGVEKTLTTLDGDIVLTVPEGVNQGETLRVRGKGVPTSKNHRGDLFVKISIDFPKKLSRTARKIVEDLKKEGM